MDTLPPRDAASLDGATITTLARGDTAFLLVPAQIDSVPSLTSIAGAAPPAGMASPISLVNAPDAAAFLGSAGTAFAVTFPPTSPTGDALTTLSVGDGSTTATLTSTVTVS